MSPVRLALALAAAAALYPPPPAAAQCQVRLTPGDGVYDSWFAEAVSLSGTTALIGANHYDLPGASEAGAVHVFVLEQGVWTEQERLFASDAAQWSYFGGAVALFDVPDNETLHRILNEWAEIIPATFEIYPLIDTGPARAYLERQTG